MIKAVLYTDLAGKNDPLTLVGKANRVPGGRKYLSTLHEQIDDDDDYPE